MFAARLTGAGDRNTYEVHAQTCPRRPAHRVRLVVAVAGLCLATSCSSGGSDPSSGETDSRRGGSTSTAVSRTSTSTTSPPPVTSPPGTTLAAGEPAVADLLDGPAGDWYARITVLGVERQPPQGPYANGFITGYFLRLRIETVRAADGMSPPAFNGASLSVQLADGTVANNMGPVTTFAEQRECAEAGPRVPAQADATAEGCVLFQSVSPSPAEVVSATYAPGRPDPEATGQPITWTL